MKVVFLGVGHWHAGMHAHAATAAGAGIAAAWDGNPDATRRFVLAHGGAVAETVEAALATEPDLVVVMGRPAEMADLAAQLIPRGVPFLIEKPVGLSGRAVRPLVDLAKEHGTFVSVALPHRLSPLLADVAGLREAGRLGRISHSHFRLINGPPQRYVDDGVAWVLDPKISGGGALRNLGIHGIDGFLDLCGPQPVEVEHVAFGRRVHDMPAEDYALVTLRAADGTVGLVEAGYTYASMTQGLFEWRVLAENAGVCDRGNGLEVATLDDGAQRESAATPVARRYDTLMADTLHRLANAMPPAVTLSDLERAMDLIDRCYAAAGTERN